MTHELLKIFSSSEDIIFAELGHCGLNVFTLAEGDIERSVILQQLVNDTYKKIGHGESWVISYIGKSDGYNKCVRALCYILSNPNNLLEIRDQREARKFNYDKRRNIFGRKRIFLKK